MKFVALFVNEDGVLGRTIFCENWEQAVAQCVLLANENGIAMTDEDAKELDEAWTCVLSERTLYIGALEEPGLEE